MLGQQLIFSENLHLDDNDSPSRTSTSMSKMFLLTTPDVTKHLKGKQSRHWRLARAPLNMSHTG